MRALSRKVNPLISGPRERVWGYASDNYSLSRAGEEVECWDIADSSNIRTSAKDGWCKGRILATAMRLELWSTPETFRRWLEG
jgi:hypothetical protein